MQRGKNNDDDELVFLAQLEVNQRGTQSHTLC